MHNINQKTEHSYKYYQYLMTHSYPVLRFIYNVCLSESFYKYSAVGFFSFKKSFWKMCTSIRVYRLKLVTSHKLLSRMKDFTINVYMQIQRTVL